MKQQQRQEDDEKDRGVERQLDERPDDVVELARQRCVEQERSSAADRDPDEGEQHGIRQMKPFRGGLDQAGENQEPGYD